MTSVPVEADGKKLIRTTKELRLVVGRDDAKAEMKADVSADEDAEGKVQAIKAKLWLGRDRVQTLDCTVVDGPKIRVTADGEFKYQTEFRWDPDCVGLGREQTLLREKKVKTGDEFRYRYFEPQVTQLRRHQRLGEGQGGSRPARRRQARASEGRRDARPAQAQRRPAPSLPGRDVLG